MRKIATRIQLDQEDFDWLQAESKRLKCSMAQAIRYLIAKEQEEQAERGKVSK